MPILPIVDFLRGRRKRSIGSEIAKAGSLLNVGEGEEIVVTYTSATDKMKVFSAFIRDGLENGDLVDYSYPDEESETIRAKLKECGIDVERYERKGSLVLDSLTEYYMPDGKFDKDRLVRKGLNDRAEAKRKGYKHYRSLDDLGDFSFLNGKWQTYVDYWDDPGWETPGSDVDILDYDPFVMECTAFNVEGIRETQLDEMLKAFWVRSSYTVYIDLLEYRDAFSELLGMPHKKLAGHKILLEFDPGSDYETVVGRLAKESMANVEPIIVFTSSTSSIHTHLSKHPTVKFFLTSISGSTLESASENKMFLPSRNIPLVLEALGNVLEAYAGMNVCLVFDILSELLTITGQDQALTFLYHALNMLYSEKMTGLFLLNANAHELEVVSGIRALFDNLLVYGKEGLKVVKTS